jgi:uncharacterized protein YeaO (DUF488 family)
LPRPAGGRIGVKRIYEEPAASDGYRLLVDRIWPRGVSRERAALDGWVKEIAPSTELRRWFGHEAARWPEFKRRYARELEDRSALVAEVLALARERRVTLLYSARDTDRNQAVALAEYLAGEPHRC